MFHQLPFSFHFISLAPHSFLKVFLWQWLLQNKRWVRSLIVESSVFIDLYVSTRVVLVLCFCSFLSYAIHVTVLYSGKAVTSYIFIFQGSCISTVVQCWSLMSLHTSLTHMFRNLDLITSSRIVHCLLLLSLLVSHFSWSTLLLHDLASHVSDCHWTSGESVNGDVSTDEKGMRCSFFLSCCSFFHCAVHVAIQYYYTIPYCTCIAQIFLHSCLIVTPSIECNALSSSCFISIDQHFSLIMF